MLIRRGGIEADAGPSGQAVRGPVVGAAVESPDQQRSGRQRKKAGEQRHGHGFGDREAYDTRTGCAHRETDCDIPLPPHCLPELQRHQADAREQQNHEECDGRAPRDVIENGIAKDTPERRDFRRPVTGGAVAKRVPFFARLLQRDAGAKPRQDDSVGKLGRRGGPYIRAEGIERLFRECAHDVVFPCPQADALADRRVAAPIPALPQARSDDDGVAFVLPVNAAGGRFHAERIEYARRHEHALRVATDKGDVGKSAAAEAQRVGNGARDREPCEAARFAPFGQKHQAAAGFEGQRAEQDAVGKLNPHAVDAEHGRQQQHEGCDRPGTAAQVSPSRGQVAAHNLTVGRCDGAAPVARDVEPEQQAGEEAAAASFAPVVEELRAHFAAILATHFGRIEREHLAVEPG